MSDTLENQNTEIDNIIECIQMQPKEYRSKLDPIWCAGCGCYGVLTALTKAFAKMELKKDRVAVVSGIGCSSRLPGFLSTWGFHGVHGRALPIAIGIKCASPELTVVVTSGDGDAYSIGAGHLPHAARRNANITLLVVNNGIYGLTKGQVSPTSKPGFITKTSPYGNVDEPINPLTLAIAQGATFVARSFSARVNHVSDMLVQAIEHKGFSLLDVLAPCVTWNKSEGFDYVKEHVCEVPETHNVNDRISAMALSLQYDPVPLGVIYKEDRPTLEDGLDEIRNENSLEKAQLSELFKNFI